ncbi:DUF1190 domain-containing protein [Enterobacter sp. ENT03]|uniref:DUF1190 domain-containing protein n=1 Tax=Enterobacter sp. ENT03 TaxID=2854780 RepID=UPI001C493EDF|nr:DUF1190 domain-containing protein [Enterobacter sp. ENT03]MBV7405999.1 DUF1190 domain-containing protein [Enterobacter sp. ENT03]
MARKRRSNQTVNPAKQTEFKQYGNATAGKRKSGRYLTLALMGGAAFFALKGCADNDQDDNNGDGVFYSTVDSCIDDGNSAQICADAWNNAKTKFESEYPKSMSQSFCTEQYGNCFYDRYGESWIPMMTGFLLSQQIRKDRDDDYHYVYGGNNYASRAVWRTSQGDYAWRSGGGSAATTKHAITTRKATTVSRGGYGRSSSARGSWGG